MAKQPKTPTSAKAWKGKTTGVDLELPSGNVCHAKRPGMDVFMREGKVPNALMPIISKTMEAAKGGKPKELELAGMMDDPEKMMAIMEFQNTVILATVKEPHILPIPAEGEARDEEELYVDEIDVLDKAFLFQWALGGAADLETFREGLATTVADMAESEEMVGTSK